MVRRRRHHKLALATTEISVIAKIGFAVQISAGVMALLAFGTGLFSVTGIIDIANDDLDPQALGESFIGAAGAPCSDGTQHGQCVAARTGNATDRPWYCSNGTLVEDSATCGCPQGYFVWGDGSCTLRPHIRAFTHDLRYDDAGLVDTSFKALHFDEVYSHTAFKSTYKALNPKVKLGTYRNFSALNDSEWQTYTPQWCATQSPACDVQDMLIHLRDDIGTRCDHFGICTYARGWNASCSPNCTPAATATSREESRKPDVWSVDWGEANFSDPDWKAYNSSEVIAKMQQGGATADIILTDNGDFFPGGSAYDKTVEYYGIPLDSSHPRIQETFDAQRELGQLVSNSLGKTVPVVPNARATTWYFHSYFHSGYQSLNNPIEIEVWQSYTDIDQPSGGVPRALYYSIDYLNTKNILAESLQGRKFYLQAVNHSTADKAKADMFMLSLFYLVNNENLSFGYRDGTQYETPSGFWPTGPASGYVYIPAIEYNIGAPILNTFNKPDVFGNIGTTEHFELATGVDPSTPNSITGSATKNYHLFARQYDGALVLAKYREYGGLLAASSQTTHDLGGEYRRLNADGTLDSTIITSITLKNNEGAILIPVAAACVESWSCTDWGTCSVQGVQVRTCSDANNCGTTVNRPDLSQICIPTPVSACQPQWECNAWSSCANNEQTRTCTDANSCGANPPANLIARQCDSAPPPTRIDPPVGGSDDPNPPDTEILPHDATIFTDRILIRWTGSDLETAAADIRYSYKLDDGVWIPYSSQTSQLFTDLPNGTHTVIVRAVDAAGNEDPVPSQTTFTVQRVLRIVTGTGPGGGPHVRTFDYLGNPVKQFFAYSKGFRGGVRVATGDVNGDGIDEIVTTPGRGGGPHVRIFNEQGVVLGQFFAFPSTFRGGLSVATGDVDADGKDEILVVPETGGGPMLRIFDGRGTLKGQFFAYAEKFRGGVNLASGDLDEDGRAEIVVAPASAGGPHVRVFEINRTGARLQSQFFAYPSSRRMGVSLAIADVLSDDGIPEIITSPTAGGFSAEIRIYTTNGVPERTFLAAANAFRGGANVAAGDLFGFDNRAEIITATYSNATPGVFIFRRIDETVLQRTRSFYAYASGFRGGVSVALGHFGR